MTFFGITLTKPSTRDITIATVIIVFFSAFFIVLSLAGLHSPSMLPFMVTAGIVGVMTSLYGIRPMKSMRHFLVFVLISGLTYLVTLALLL